MGILDIFKRGKDGKLEVQNPNFNRHERRAMVAMARHRPAQNRRDEAERLQSKAKMEIRARVERKQKAAHERALARKAAKKGFDHSAFQGGAG